MLASLGATTPSTAALSPALSSEADGDMEQLFQRLGLRNLAVIVASREANLRSVAILVLSISTAFSCCFFYMAFLSKAVPDTGIWLIDEVKRDSFYCYLLPLLTVPLFFLYYANWLSMKIFQHN